MRWNVMLIDDDVEMQQMISVCLENAGYTVRSAYDGASALEELRQNEYDLILLDLTMPGLSGAQLLKKLRASSDLRALPVIILTGNGDKNTFLRLRSEVNDYVLKPPLKSNILKRIERVLGTKPPIQEISVSAKGNQNVGAFQLPVVLSSISPRGMIVLCPVPLQKNQILERLSVPLLNEIGLEQKHFFISTCKAKAPGMFECYVSFLDMSPTDRTKLKEWISKKSA